MSSKKFLMAIIGMVAFGLAKKGINLDTEATYAFLSPLIAAIIGQGVADHGKSAAQITVAGGASAAASDAGAVAPSSSPPAAQAGSVVINLLLLLALAAGVAMALAGCSSVNKAAHGVASAFEDCTVGPAKQVVHEAGPLMDIALVQAIGNGGKFDPTPIKGVAANFTAQVGGCLFADAVTRAVKAFDDPSAPRSSPLDVDKASLLAGFAALNAERFGNTTFHTASGDLK
jgi:hypothetical protein